MSAAAAASAEGEPALAQRLAAALQRLVEPADPGVDAQPLPRVLVQARVQGLRRLSGGASQETWAFDLVLPSGVLPLILRRAPPGAQHRATGNPGLATEAVLIARAGQAGVPVPAVRHVLQAQDGLGEGFVMQRLPGETLGRRIAAAPRAVLTHQCGQALARIHGLTLLGLPPLRSVQPRSEVAHLRQWHARHGTLRPVFQLALRWLADHAPGDAPPVLLHGDFRNGNLMVDLQAEGGALVGVLDWELAGHGDAMSDLGWLMANPWRFGQPDRAVGGFGDLATLLAGYGAVGGAAPDPGRLRWWQVLATLRWGVICESMAQAWLTGAEPVLEKAAIGRRASETEIDLLALLLPYPAGLAALPQTQPHTTLHDRPQPDQLLAAVARFLRDVVARPHGPDADPDPALAYQAKVAANMLEIVRREHANTPDDPAAERAALRELLAASPAALPSLPLLPALPELPVLHQRLVDAIASGALIPASQPALADWLWRCTLAKLAVDQPRYDTYQRVLGAPT